jgi:hypothetical protein
MAKQKSTRGRKSATDGPVTAAERNRAIKFLRKQGGAHVSRPANGLIQDTPGHTVDRCKAVINWLAHIEQPFHDSGLDAAQADVLLLVVDALDHASRVVHAVGADTEVTNV